MRWLAARRCFSTARPPLAARRCFTSLRSPFETPERNAFRTTVRDFVAAEVTPHVDAWDEAGDIPWELHAKVGALGAWGFGIDERYGGLGFDDAFMRAIYSEELAMCGAGGVWAGLNGRMISVEPIYRLANEEIKERALSKIVSGHAGSCLGVTEPGGGSDVAAMTTTARLDGDAYVLNGSKTFITGGMKADYFVIAARTGGPGLGGISLFFVDRDTPGFERASIDRKMGWWASDTATLFFSDCRVPASHLMGVEDKGFLSIMENFNHERVGLIAGMLGMMRVCLTESIAWAQQRKTFGQPLIHHQVIRHKLAEMSSRIDAVEAYTNHVCWAINEGEMPVAEISKCKFFTSKQTEFVASEAMQILGGAGYLRGSPVERIYREVKVMAIGGGSEEIMRDLAVRQMGL